LIHTHPRGVFRGVRNTPKFPSRREPTFLISKALAVLLVILASACGGGAGGGASPDDSGETRSFEELSEEAEGSTVRFFGFGGDERTNEYLDEWVAPRLEEEYGITLERTPLSDTSDVVNKLLNERQAGDENGTTDLVWINGENFYTGSQAELWFGPWAERLPNAEFIDYDDPNIALDFGYPVEGMEAPWSQAQFVMVYDSAEVDDPPRSFAELAAWTEENPGRFTYPAPPDFFGNAFVLQALYEISGDVEAYGEPFDEGTFEERVPEFVEYFEGIEADLWRKGETYPRSGAALDELYQNGEVDMTMSYNPYSARELVENGVFPDSTRTYLFEDGTLSNTSYLAIPFNAPNTAGAQVAANFMQSPEAQAELQRRNVVGGLATLDVGSLPQEDRASFEGAGTSGEAVIPLEELQENQLPEARTKWTLELQDAWISEVQRN
jgi:putative spermidine/putrescine transport system substrate-binding protein